MSAHKGMMVANKILASMGHLVMMPSLGNINEELDSNGDTVETAHIKIKTTYS